MSDALPMSVHEAKAILAANASITSWADNPQIEVIDRWRRIVEAAEHRLKHFTTDTRTITGAR